MPSPAKYCNYYKDTVGRFEDVPKVKMHYYVFLAKREADDKLRELIATLREEWFTTEIAYFQERLQNKAECVAYARDYKKMLQEAKQAKKATTMVRRRALYLLLRQDHLQYISELEKLEKTFHNQRV